MAGLARPSTRSRALSHCNVLYQRRKVRVFNRLRRQADIDMQFLQHDRVDGRDKPGHDGDRGARKTAPLTWPRGGKSWVRLDRSRNRQRQIADDRALPSPDRYLYMRYIFRNLTRSMGVCSTSIRVG